MKKKLLYTVLLLGCSSLIYGQNPAVIVNEGEMSISTGDLMSFVGSFTNRANGNVTNDGTVIYFDNFANEGYYGVTSNRNTSRTIFKEEVVNDIKRISGNGISAFYDVEFNSLTPTYAFDLKNNIDINGTADFIAGIVKVDADLNPATGVSYGMVTFLNGSKAINAKSSSFVDGQVEKIGKNAFTFPTGDKGIYSYARISAPQKESEAFVSKYTYNDQAFFDARPNSVGVINTVNNTEYWLVDKADNQESNVLLTLSWADGRTSPDVLKNPEEELHIVRWDDKQQMWVDEGGVVDMSSKEVTTIAAVKGYGFFTFATVKKDWVLDGDVVIYNLVTTDGDGKNDYLIIDNIQSYPNKLEIFNRWGARVYETTQYDPHGDGSTNVFKGYSDGKVTVDKGSKLPSGTYYYVLTYEYTDSNGSRMIKKAANLHLENN